ncbi:MAG: GNAT family N-acetyltransferase [Candidatus Promineofilum sp.]|nr:GNAT family N-acetyltransferase [Promineifilum sp.]
MEIIIRRATPDDAEAIARIFDTPRALRGTLQVPYVSTEFRRRRLSETDDNVHPLAAVVDGEVIGQLTLHTSARPRRKHAAGLGMAVRDDMQGQGVGTALMRACTDLADNWLNIHRLELEVFVDNEPAIHLYHKFGFVTEGRLVDYGFRDGEYVDVFVMGRIRPAAPGE